VLRNTLPHCKIVTWTGLCVECIRLNEGGPKFRVAVRASADGRFTFEIFSVSGEPRTLQVGRQYYATPDDAERAGYAAIAAKGASLV
jgi:hypothetical protein